MRDAGCEVRGARCVLKMSSLPILYLLRGERAGGGGGRKEFLCAIDSLCLMNPGMISWMKLDFEKEVVFSLSSPSHTLPSTAMHVVLCMLLL